MHIEAIEHALRKELTEKRDLLKKVHDVHNLIGEEVRKWNGKILNKRFTDKVTEAVQTYFGNRYFCCSYPHPGRLYCWDGSYISYNNRWGFCITTWDFPVSKRVTVEEFEENDKTNGKHTLDAIERLNDYLDEHSPVLQNLAEKIHATRTATKILADLIDNEHYFVRHEVERLVKA